MKFNSEHRIRLISVVFAGIAVLSIGRLYFLQIVHGESYREKADSDILASGEKIFDRGTIFFENKDGTLATVAAIKNGYTLSVNPSKIIDVEQTFNKLSFFIKIDRDEFLKKTSVKTDPYEEIAKKISEETGDKIKEMKLPGVLVIKEKWRIYPADTLAAHTLGFVGYDGKTSNGRYGLERYYEDNLQRNSDLMQKNFFLEIFSNAKKISSGGNELESDIISSINPTVERMLEDELKNVNTEYGSKSSGGIIMNPSNGEILAIASYPTFNPNYYGKEKDIAIFSNPLVEKVYEMGSILKPITVATGLDSKTITASTTYKDEGFLKVNDRTIYNFDRKGRGIISMQEVLNQSLNTGAMHIALLLGKKKFADYIVSFGLGEETGIDLPGEAGSLIKNLLKGGDVELANASFGQGMAITPIAMTRALSALGNGGLLPNPHIIKKVNYKLGFSKNVISTEEEMRRVIKKETSEEITRMLVEVVDKALKGGTLKMDRYSIAAKTGTAQIADKENGGYYADRFLHSFFGYFPAYNPRFIVFLYTIEPQADYASNTLSNPFMNIAKFLINYYQIPPDR